MPYLGLKNDYCFSFIAFYLGLKDAVKYGLKCIGLRK